MAEYRQLSTSKAITSGYGIANAIAPSSLKCAPAGDAIASSMLVDKRRSPKSHGGSNLPLRRHCGVGTAPPNLYSRQRTVGHRSAPAHAVGPLPPPRGARGCWIWPPRGERGDREGGCIPIPCSSASSAAASPCIVGSESRQPLRPTPFPLSSGGVRGRQCRDSARGREGSPAPDPATAAAPRAAASTR